MGGLVNGRFTDRFCNTSGLLIGSFICRIVIFKKEMKEEFFKGDGTIPWWVTSVSIFATLLSPISFLSLAEILILVDFYGGT